jgi:hypothetical protein
MPGEVGKPRRGGEHGAPHFSNGLAAGSVRRPCGRRPSVEHPVALGRAFLIFLSPIIVGVGAAIISDMQRK